MMTRCISALSSISALRTVKNHFHVTYLLDHNPTKRMCDENDRSLFLLDLAVSGTVPNVASRGQPLTS